MEKIYYAIKDKNKLALFDGRLPIFWLRKIANSYNAIRLNGEGQVVKVVVTEQENSWDLKDKKNLISYLKTVIQSLEEGKESNLNGEDYAKGELSAFKRTLDWIAK